MTAASRLWFYRCRRATALAAAFAFLLVSFAATVHRDEKPRRLGCTLHHKTDFAEKANFLPAHPHDCFACFWSRTAIAAGLPARPHLDASLTVGLRSAPGARNAPHCNCAGYLSRAPPSLLA